MSKGKLKPEDEECIRRNYVQIKENIDTAHIVDFLYQERVISLDDKEKIQKGNTKIERSDILIEIILNSGPGDAFEKFIESLIRKNQYPHLDIVQEKLKCHQSNVSTDISCSSADNAIQKDTQTDGMLNKEIQISQFDLAILLVGESGCGKSTTLKTLKNDKKINFQSNGIANVAFCGRQIQFVDSPSIDIYIPDTQKLISDATESIETISEGFHAILLVIKYHSKMENQYFQTYIERLKSLYGPNILNKYCILVITRGDLITAENVNFKDWCCQQTGAFAKLYEECGQRAVLIDNKTKDESILKEQMNNLMSEIDSLQFNGRRYTYLQFREAENGRKKMLIQEKEPNVTKEIMAKCTSIMDSYKNIGNHSNSNTLQLKSLYEEVEKMKQEVLEIDEGSDILSYAISLVDHLHTLVAKWMEDQITIQVMHSNKEIQEKRFLKKTSKIEAIKHGEEEKFRLNREIIKLKEDNSMMKVQMKRYDDELSEFKKSKDEKLKELKTSEKLFIINCVDVHVDESSSIGQSLKSVPQVKLNEEESEVICNTETSKSSDRIHTKYSDRRHFVTINICLQWATIFMLCLIIGVGNFHSFQRSKNNFLTGLDLEGLISNAVLEKSTKICKYNNYLLNATIKWKEIQSDINKFKESHSELQSSCEELMVNYSSLVTENINLRQNFSIFERRLSEIERKCGHMNKSCKVVYL